MSVDTAEKCYSMIAFGDDNQMLFEVDGAVDLDDRQHLLGCYSGIAFGGGPTFQVAWAVNSNTVIQSTGVL